MSTNIKNKLNEILFHCLN